jgi:hypothetical protein
MILVSVSHDSVLCLVLDKLKCLVSNGLAAVITSLT